MPASCSAQKEGRIVEDINFEREGEAGGQSLDVRNHKRIESEPEGKSEDRTVAASFAAVSTPPAGKQTSPRSCWMTLTTVRFSSPSKLHIRRTTETIREHRAT